MAAECPAYRAGKLKRLKTPLLPHATPVKLVVSIRSYRKNNEPDETNENQVCTADRPSIHLSGTE
jgi:hypothetical protein